MITLIDIAKLKEHPDNPRKELGNIVELAAAINDDDREHAAS